MLDPEVMTRSRTQANVAFAEGLRERYIDRGVPLDCDALTSSERVRAILGAVASAFRDARFEIASRTVDDERVVFIGRFSGTHGGPWRGIAPTGRHVSAAALISLLCADGVILDPDDGGRFIGHRTAVGCRAALGPKACELLSAGFGDGDSRMRRG
jgi:predicted ester cyclase